jgi:hypothetical protein
MVESKASDARSSSGKGQSGEKTFNIPVSNGIFEHHGALGDAVWLLLLFVDWTTKECEVADGTRDGLVHGGKPIRDKDIAIAFHSGICTRTVRRWRQRLADHGYIIQKRTPVGHVIRVKKSKKYARLDSSDPRVIGLKCPVRPDKNVRSEVPVLSDQTGHNEHFRSASSVRSNKDSTGQDKDVAVDRADKITAAAASPSLLRSEKPNPKAWTPIKLDPIGSPDFQRAWEKIYVDRPSKEHLADTMERCIQGCRDIGVSVPKLFFDAKRRVEADPPESEGLPRLEPIRRDVPPEIARFGSAGFDPKYLR